MTSGPPPTGSDADALHLPDFGARTSLRQQVTEALRGALVTGAMRPGAMYSAPALAAKLGVSATPVREAMLDLAKEGLVEAVRNKGFRVTELTDSDLDAITEIRMLLEVPSVEKIAGADPAPPEPALAELRVVADHIERHAETGDLIAYVEADRQFHLDLLRLAGNHQLVAIVGDLRARTRLFGLRYLVDRGALGDSAAEHAELIDLIAAGDAPGAGALMRRHIGHIRGSWAGPRPESSG